jgi:hypothetical protein
MKILNSGAMKLGLVYNKLAGPWPCEQCGQTTQFAEMKGDKNHIFCRNEYCKFERIVDMKSQIIREPDGSFWKYNPNTGQKIRIKSR